jgi:hypothetical protein
MARWKSGSDLPPERLCRFLAGEWPGDDPLADWRRSALAWLAQDPSRRMPFGDAGDELDVLKESIRIKSAGAL